MSVDSTENQTNQAEADEDVEIAEVCDVWRGEPGALQRIAQNVPGFWEATDTEDMMLFRPIETGDVRAGDCLVNVSMMGRLTPDGAPDGIEPSIVYGFVYQVQEDGAAAAQAVLAVRLHDQKWIGREYPDADYWFRWAMQNDMFTVTAKVTEQEAGAR